VKNHVDRSSDSDIQRSRGLAKSHAAFRPDLSSDKNYPADELYGLTAETRKTSRSVPYNIAAGHKRSTTADYIRFLNIAAGSVGELEIQLLLAARLRYLQEDSAQVVLAFHAEVERMLDSLIPSLKAKIHADP
jgi:four helix bundle protein